MAGSMLSNTGLSSKYYILAIVQSGCLVNLSPGANNYHLYINHVVISTGRRLLKLVLTVEYLLLFCFFLTAAEFCCLGHLQGTKITSFELRHPYKSDL